MPNTEKVRFTTSGDFEHITRETDYSIVLQKCDSNALVAYISDFGESS